MKLYPFFSPLFIRFIKKKKLFSPLFYSIFEKKNKLIKTLRARKSTHLTSLPALVITQGLPCINARQLPSPFNPHPHIAHLSPRQLCSCFVSKKHRERDTTSPMRVHSSCSDTTEGKVCVWWWWGGGIDRSIQSKRTRSHEETPDNITIHQLTHKETPAHTKKHQITRRNTRSHKETPAHKTIHQLTQRNTKQGSVRI